MQSKETKGKKTKSGCIDFGCCGPEDIKQMFESKCRCFSGQDETAECSSMKKDMMGKMVEMCCSYEDVSDEQC